MFFISNALLRVREHVALEKFVERTLVPFMHVYKRPFAHGVSRRSIG